MFRGKYMDDRAELRKYLVKLLEESSPLESKTSFKPAIGMMKQITSLVRSEFYNSAMNYLLYEKELSFEKDGPDVINKELLTFFDTQWKQKIEQLSESLLKGPTGKDMKHTIINGMKLYS